MLYRCQWHRRNLQIGVASAYFAWTCASMSLRLCRASTPITFKTWLAKLSGSKDAGDPLEKSCIFQNSSVAVVDTCGREFVRVFDFGDFELLNAANGLDVKYINLPGHSSSCAASGSHLSVQLQSTSINCICCPYAARFLSISGPRLLEGMQERGCQAQLSATAAKV